MATRDRNAMARRHTPHRSNPSTARAGGSKEGTLKGKVPQILEDVDFHCANCEHHIATGPDAWLKFSRNSAVHDADEGELVMRRKGYEQDENVHEGKGELDGCLLNPIYCLKCSEKLGMWCSEAPPGQDLFHERVIFKLPSVSVKGANGKFAGLRTYPLADRLPPRNGPKARDTRPDLSPQSTYDPRPVNGKQQDGVWDDDQGPEEDPAEAEVFDMLDQAVAGIARQEEYILQQDEKLEQILHALSTMQREFKALKSTVSAMQHQQHPLTSSPSRRRISAHGSPSIGVDVDASPRRQNNGTASASKGWSSKSHRESEEATTIRSRNALSKQLDATSPDQEQFPKEDQAMRAPSIRVNRATEDSWSSIWNGAPSVRGDSVPPPPVVKRSAKEPVFIFHGNPANRPKGSRKRTREVFIDPATSKRVEDSTFTTDGRYKYVEQVPNKGKRICIATDDEAPPIYATAEGPRDHAGRLLRADGAVDGRSQRWREYRQMKTQWRESGVVPPGFKLHNNGKEVIPLSPSERLMAAAQREAAKRQKQKQREGKDDASTDEDSSLIDPELLNLADPSTMQNVNSTEPTANPAATDGNVDEDDVLASAPASASPAPKDAPRPLATSRPSSAKPEDRRSRETSTSSHRGARARPVVVDSSDSEAPDSDQAAQKARPGTRKESKVPELQAEAISKTDKPHRWLPKRSPGGTPLHRTAVAEPVSTPGA